MQATAFQLVLHAGLFVKLILLLLAGFSIVSWAIILYKYFYLRAATRESAAFLAVYDSGVELKDLAKTAATLTLSPLANVVTVASATHAHGHRDEVRLLLARQQTVETEKLQGYLIFLATTGSTTPFIGLLGTVWGIMDAFRGIGATGSASLAVVAPAIAEALITTAAGLAAAIPAVMAYNVFVRWVRRLTLQLEDFSSMLEGQLAKRAG